MSSSRGKTDGHRGRSPRECYRHGEWNPAEVRRARQGSRTLARLTPEAVVEGFSGFRRRRGTTTIAVRTNGRPDLLERFELAMTMKSDLTAELSVARRKRSGPRALAHARARGRSSEVVRLGLRVVSADGVA